MDEGFQYIGDSSTNRGRSKKPFIILLLLLILGIGGFFAFTQGPSLVASLSPSPTPTMVPTQVPTPTLEPTATPEPSGTAKKSPTPKATPTTSKSSSIDKTTGLDRSILTITVQNGSGTAGVAGTMSTFLKDLGYSVSGSGNADNFDYQNVVIQVKASEAKYLPLLKSDIATKYTVGSASATLSSGSTDAIVIVGK